MAHTPKTIDKAIAMRRQGIGIPSIAIHLGISKSTASKWLRDIELSDSAIANLAKRSSFGTQKGLARIKSVKDAVSRVRAAEMDILAKNFTNGIDAQKWKIVAALIFWCEGSKRHLSTLKFVNSDPEMIQLFLKALRNGFGIDENKLKALLHLHQYHNENEMVVFWSRVTGIKREQFNRSYIKPNSGKRERDGYKGCIALCYGEANLARKLDALYHSLSKHLGAW